MQLPNGRLSSPLRRRPNRTNCPSTQAPVDWQRALGRRPGRQPKMRAQPFEGGHLTGIDSSSLTPIVQRHGHRQLPQSRDRPESRSGRREINPETELVYRGLPFRDRSSHHHPWKDASRQGQPSCPWTGRWRCSRERGISPSLASMSMALRSKYSIVQPNSRASQPVVRESEHSQPEKYSTPSSPLLASDDDLITKACQAQNGSKFDRLWDGQWEGDYPSQSEADLALCCLLAFWTRKDRARIDGLFRRSGMMREKWLREDYREDTIAKAIAMTGDTWDPGQLARPNGSEARGAQSRPRHTFPSIRNGQSDCSRKLSAAWWRSWWRLSIRTPRLTRLLCSCSS